MSDTIKVAKELGCHHTCLLAKSTKIGCPHDECDLQTGARDLVETNSANQIKRMRGEVMTTDTQKFLSMIERSKKLGISGSDHSAMTSKIEALIAEKDELTHQLLVATGFGHQCAENIINLQTSNNHLQQELERLRMAMHNLLKFPSGQYSSSDGYDEAYDAALALLPVEDKDKS
jgi:hypothetical protein